MPVHFQAAKRVESWFPEDTQLQARQQAELETITSLLGALHATGDIKAAASLDQSLTDSVSRNARESAADVPDASITAARAQAMALRLASVRKVIPCFEDVWASMSTCCAALPVVNTCYQDWLTDTLHMHCMQRSTFCTVSNPGLLVGSSASSTQG